MPRYRAVNANVRLYAASLGAAITPEPTTRKGPDNLEKVADAESALRNGRVLSETVVGVPQPNGEDGGRVHFLGSHGNIPFLMVHAGADLFANQEIPARRASDRHSISSATRISHDGDNKDENENEPQEDTKSVSTMIRGRRPSHDVLTASDIDLAPQALCVQVFLSPETYLFDPNVNVRNGGGRDMKVEVFFNGGFTEASFMPGRDRNVKSRPISYIFSGERCTYLSERPWVIVPPGQDADGSLRGSLKRSKILNNVTTEERWRQIGATLLAEADVRGFNKYGDRPPSGDFLESLAKMQMPSAVDAMQKPGGPKFGVIDVIFTVGSGTKNAGPSIYMQKPTRLTDNNFKTFSEEQKAEREIQKAEREAKRKLVQEAANSTFVSSLSYKTADGIPLLGSPLPPFLRESPPPPILRDFLPSSSFSDYLPSPNNGRHKQGQIRMGSLGRKGATLSLSTDSGKLSLGRRASLPNPALGVTLRSRENSLNSSANSLNLMPPPPAPTPITATSPNKRRRVSLPTPDGNLKKRRMSERISAARPTVEPIAQLSIQTTPPSSIGISRRGVFTGIGSPTAIPSLTFPSAPGSDPKQGKIVIEGDPFEPRIILPTLNNPFSSPNGLPAGSLGFSRGTITPGDPKNSQTSSTPSVIIKRVIIKADKKIIMDKTLTTSYRLALSRPNVAPPVTQPRRRSVRIMRSETPGSAPYAETSPKSRHARRDSNLNPTTPPPSSSPLKNASAAQGRTKDGNLAKLINRAQDGSGNVAGPSYLLSRIRARHAADMPSAKSEQMEQVMKDLAEQASPDKWSWISLVDQISEDTTWHSNHGVGASPQQSSSSGGSLPQFSNQPIGTANKETAAQQLREMSRSARGRYQRTRQNAESEAQRSMSPGSQTISQPLGLPPQVRGAMGSGFVQQSNNTTSNPFQQSNRRQSGFPEQPSETISATSQASVPSMELGGIQVNGGPDSLRRMKIFDIQDTIHVRPRVPSAPGLTISPPLVLGPLAIPKPTTPASSHVVQKHPDSLGTDDSPFSSVPSQLSTPKDYGITPPDRKMGEENKGGSTPREGPHPHPQAHVSTSKGSIQVMTELAPFDKAMLSEDCVITFAKAGPWSTIPITGDVVRQVRGAKPGVFREEEVVFGVRFLVG